MFSLTIKGGGPKRRAPYELLVSSTRVEDPCCLVSKWTETSGKTKRCKPFGCVLGFGPKSHVCLCAFNTVQVIFCRPKDRRILGPRRYVFFRRAPEGSANPGFHHPLKAAPSFQSTPSGADGQRVFYGFQGKNVVTTRVSEPFPPGFFGVVASVSTDRPQ